MNLFLFIYTFLMTRLMVRPLGGADFHARWLKRRGLTTCNAPFGGRKFRVNI